MIYYSADDYGLNNISSMYIKRCIDEGKLNKVSVFPNFDRVNLNEITKNKNVRVSLHLNLVEGRCMAKPEDVKLLADDAGNFKHTFVGLFKLYLFNRKKFEEQVYKEIKAQVLFWKSILPENIAFCIDSHQHIHMIPAIFKALINVLTDEKINLKYIRIPAEPILPYIKKPSLYHTYSTVNIVKQWLLKYLWLYDKKFTNKIDIPTAYFLGILFSGNMDEKRINKILPEYIRLAEKNGEDIEILFHPGYIDKSEINFKDKNIVFEDFYLSENRKTEFDSVMNIKERSVL